MHVDLTKGQTFCQVICREAPASEDLRGLLGI